MEFNSTSGSVYSKNIGSQFRLKYNNILENEKSIFETITDCQFILPTPKEKRIYIRTSNYNAVRKLDKLAETYISFSLEDKGKNLEYLNCFVESINQDIDTLTEIDTKFEIVIYFSNSRILKN